VKHATGFTWMVGVTTGIIGHRWAVGPLAASPDNPSILASRFSPGRGVPGASRDSAPEDRLPPAVSQVPMFIRVTLFCGEMNVDN
jgi:hypothetical protein